MCNFQGQSEEILNVPTIDFPANGEGLDQVPTRLPTKVKSGATTPTKGKSIVIYVKRPESGVLQDEPSRFQGELASRSQPHIGQTDIC